MVFIQFPHLCPMIFINVSSCSFNFPKILGEHFGVPSLDLLRLGLEEGLRPRRTLRDSLEGDFSRRGPVAVHGEASKNSPRWREAYGALELSSSSWGYPARWIDWIVYFTENPMKMDDDWGYPHFRKPPFLWWIVTIILGYLLDISRSSTRAIIHSYLKNYHYGIS